MGANDLDLILKLSGLPQDYARLRLDQLLLDAGFDPGQSGVEEVREVLSSLLQDLILATDRDS